MSRKKKKKKKKHGSTHHLLPRSRGGPGKPFWNKADKPVEKHRAFHTLSCTSFNKNLLPCEFINKVNEQWTKKSGGLKRSKLTKKQKQAWEILFDSDSTKWAVKIIRRYWTVKDQSTFRGCFGYKECFSGSHKKVCPLIKFYKKGVIR